MDKAMSTKGRVVAIYHKETRKVLGYVSRSEVEARRHLNGMFITFRKPLSPVGRIGNFYEVFSPWDFINSKTEDPLPLRHKLGHRADDINRLSYPRGMTITKRYRLKLAIVNDDVRVTGVIVRHEAEYREIKRAGV